MTIFIAEIEEYYEHERSLRKKNAAYFSSVRSDVLDVIPGNPKRILDVGCGSGETGLAAKLRFGPHCEVVGIEFHPTAALSAKEKLDRVIVGDIESLTLDFPKKNFDCILCADILEHTKNPWDVLSNLRTYLSDDGVLIASLPNLRHIDPILKIIFNRFDYEESGLLDITHLRFFTLHTIREMLRRAGFRIDDITTNRSATWKLSILTFLSLGLLRQFTVIQYILVARKQ